jgi:hypothetical protein
VIRSAHFIKKFPLIFAVVVLESLLAVVVLELQNMSLFNYDMTNRGAHYIRSYSTHVCHRELLSYFRADLVSIYKDLLVSKLPMLANRQMFQWLPSTTIFASEKKKGERGAEVRKSRQYSMMCF